MELLINKDILNKYFKIADGVPKSEIERHIHQSQLFDLKPSIPDQFFYDLLQNKSNVEYKLILNGGTYIDEDDDNQVKYISGFNEILSYFTYARFVLSGDVVSSTHGLVRVAKQGAESLTFAERRSISDIKRKEGHLLLAQLKDYLDDQDFDSYDDGDCNITGGNYTPKISVIQ